MRCVEMRTLTQGEGPGRWFIALALLFSACGQQPVVVPEHSFDRPTDMTFVCVGLSGSGSSTRVSGKPMAFCHPPDGTDPLPDVKTKPSATTPFPRQRGTFGVLTNSARGEVAVV